MKGGVAAVERTDRLTRAALMVDGQLVAIEIDRHGEAVPLPGAIYRCRITDTIPAIGAAFADIGGGSSGFFPNAKGLISGQTLLAQVQREPEGDKAARLTTELQYRGEALVFTPQRPGINVSRKIGDEAERSRLSAALAPLVGEGGFVLRTAAIGFSSEALLARAQALVAQYRANSAPTGTLGCVVPAPDAFTRLREGMPPNTPIIANTEWAAEFDGTVQIDPAPFDHLDIDTRIDDLLAPRIALGEGWISVDPTPALVAVDVNSAGARHGNALLRVNLEAATRLPLILSLLRLGGVVMVDFAGAPKGDARKRIEETIARAARTHLDSPRLHGWGPAGLFEMACKRPGRSLADLLKENDA